jgi:hypothetical protein
MPNSIERLLVEGNFLDRMTALEARVNYLMRRETVVDALSDLTPELGEVNSGRLKFGTDTDLGSGFSGVMGGFPGVDLDTPDGVKTFLIAAIMADALGAGFTDQGELYAQAGKIAQWVLDNDLLRSANFGIVLDAINEQISVGSTGSKLIIDGIGKAFKSSNYVPGASGSYLDASGFFETGDGLFRGSISSVVFKKDLLSAHAGGMIISKSAGMLSIDYTPGGQLEVQNTLDSSWLFDTGDIVRLADGLNTTWLSVTQLGAGNENKYSVSFLHGSNTTTFLKGSTVVDYGPAGSSFLQMQAGSGNTMGSYYALRSHSGQPWTDQIEHVRIGDLKGLLNYPNSTIGMIIGNSNSYLAYDPTKGLQIKGSVQLTNQSGSLSDALRLDGLLYSLIHSATIGSYSRSFKFGMVNDSGVPAGVLDYFDSNAGTNLLTVNPGFEDSTLTPWTVSLGTVVQSTTQKYEGSKSARMQVYCTRLYLGDDIFNVTNSSLRSTSLAVTAGAVYDFSAYYYKDAAVYTSANTLLLSVEWYNGGTLLAVSTPANCPTTGSWDKASLSGLQAPTGATSAKILMSHSIDGGSVGYFPGAPNAFYQYVYVDKVDFHATANYTARMKVSDNQFTFSKPVAVPYGYTMPTAPTRGFAMNDKGILYWGENGSWLPVCGTKNMTLYVSTTGTDDLNHGHAGGSSAFRTISYAVNQIPTSYTGVVYIMLESGSWSENVWISDKACMIHIYGTLTAVATRTETISYDGTTGWGNVPSVSNGNGDRIITVINRGTFINHPYMGGMSSNIIGHPTNGAYTESLQYTEYQFATNLNSSTIYVTNSKAVSLHNLNGGSSNVAVWYKSTLFVDSCRFQDILPAHGSYVDIARSFVRALSCTQGCTGAAAISFIGITSNIAAWYNFVTSGNASNIVLRTVMLGMVTPNTGQRCCSLYCSEDSSINVWCNTITALNSGLNVFVNFNSGAGGTSVGVWADTCSAVTGYAENSTCKFYGTWTTKTSAGASSFGFIG